MKVLMMASNMPCSGGGGIERHVYELAKGLDRRGVDVTIVCENTYNFPGVCDLKDVKSIEVRRGIVESFNLLKKSYNLYKAVRMDDYDIVHAHAQYGFFTLLRHRLPNSLVTLHGTSAEIGERLEMIDVSHGRLRMFPSALMEGISARRAGCCIAVSQSVASEAARHYGVAKDRIKVVYNWVDKDRFFRRDKRACREKLGLGLDERYLLFVGRTDNIKGYELLVKAMEKVDATLLVASKNATGGKNIKCLGYVDDELLPFYYSACDFFAFPTIYEGFSLTLLEALACGTVPVCMDTPSVLEAAGECAYVCKSYEAQEYADTIKRALDGPDLADTCVERSKRFDMERSIDETYGLYRTLC